MATTIDSVRFGKLECDDETLVEFPHGLIGLPGTRYAFVDPNPDSGIRWLHSAEDPALALPVLDPRVALASFSLSLGAEERERIGVQDVAEAEVYVTVRAAPDPGQTTVNLRAPLIVWRGRGHQVINTAPGAELRAPLFAAASSEA